MAIMDITKLKRNPSKIKSKLKMVGESVVTTDELKVIFPNRYTSKDLCYMDKVVFLIAYYCIVDKDNNYAISNYPVFQFFKPDDIENVVINNNGKDENYVVMRFNKDSIMITNTNLIQDASVIYNIIREFLIVGNIPWFLEYEDLSNILLESKKYTGNGVGSNPIGLEILASIVTRANDSMVLYKNTLSKQEDINKIKPSYIGLDKVLSYDDTGSKIIGSYLDQGLTSAVVHKEESSSDVSELLRK